MQNYILHEILHYKPLQFFFLYMFLFCVDVGLYNIMLDKLYLKRLNFVILNQNGPTTITQALNKVNKSKNIY